LEEGGGSSGKLSRHFLSNTTPVAEGMGRSCEGARTRALKALREEKKKKARVSGLQGEKGVFGGVVSMRTAIRTRGGVGTDRRKGKRLR